VSAPTPPPPGQSMDHTLGVEIVEHAEGLCRGRIPVTDAIKQPYGLVHGGAFLTLAESLTSMGTYAGVAPEGRVAMGQEINASLLRPITEGYVNGTARLRRKGRTAWVWEVEIADDDGRLCALIRATIAVRDAPG
jgi:1,4-dihydroxy-2-naphthoyl-CoA hydrolase